MVLKMKFKSTKDVARYFRAMANEAKDRMNREINIHKRNHLAGETVAYYAAANVLEQVELEK